MRKLLILLLGLFFLSLAFAQETNLTDQEFSRQCLDSSVGIMSSLESEGFNILRINDTLVKAQTIYDSQYLVERQGRDGEYSFVIDSCEEIEVLYELAIKARDDLGVFVGFYEETRSSGMNTTSVDLIIVEIEKEINDERYEKADPLIEQAYEEFSRVQEEYGRLNKFYAATSRSFTLLLKEYGYYTLSVLVVLILIYLAYRVRIKKLIVRHKINNLRLRKKSLKALMEKTQKEYFQKGNISEADYQLRSKNFATLVRDIDRELPLLEEKLIKVDTHGIKNGKIEADFKKEERKQKKKSTKRKRSK